MRTIDKRNIVAAIFFLLLGGFAIYLTLTTFVRAGASSGGPLADTAFYPRLLAGIIVFLAILLIIATLRNKAAGRPDLDDETEEEQREREMSPLEKETQHDRVQPRTQLLIAAILVAYVYLLDVIGYLVLTPIFMIVLFRLLKIKNWLATISLAIASSAVLYVFFSVFLDVIFPRGILF